MSVIEPGSVLVTALGWVRIKQSGLNVW